MALVDRCFCCGLPIAAGFFAVYLLIAYIIAFGFELLWIMESPIALPPAAILLCAGYFTLVLFAALLIHGIATKNITCLVGWMFATTILTFPEAGLVMYMSVQYWRIESFYGITELSCWLTRILVNVVQLILVQSLYSTWKDEEIIVSRLAHINGGIRSGSVINGSIAPENLYYQNNAFTQSIENLSSGIAYKRAASIANLWNENAENLSIISPYDDNQLYSSNISEFNASMFDPITIESKDEIGKKSQSMNDLRSIDEKNLYRDKVNLWFTQNIEDTNAAIPNYNLTVRYQNTNRHIPRPQLQKYVSVEDLNDNSQIIRNKTGFYARPIENYGVPIYYGPLDGPDFLIYKKQMEKLTSKNSLESTNSVEEVEKIRDVAL